MKIELTEQQQQALLVIIDNSNIKGADAEFILELRRMIKTPIKEQPNA